MAEALVTLLGEPKKYGVLVVDREQVEEKPGENQKKTELAVGAGSFGTDLAAVSKWNR